MAEYTDEERGQILAEFRRRSRYEALIMLMMVGGAALAIFVLEYPGYHIGSFHGMPLVAFGGAVAVVALVLHQRNWRCPGCGKPLKGGVAKSACPACGAVFVEASRRAVARAAAQSGTSLEAAAQRVAAEKALKREVSLYRSKNLFLVRPAIGALLIGGFLIVYAIVRTQENAPTSQILLLYGGGAALLAVFGFLGYRIHLHTNVRVPIYEAQLREKLGLPPAERR